jgi:integrase
MPETAARVRSRIERILDYAAVTGYRPTGPNPTKWGGHLENLLPSRVEMVRSGAVEAVKNHEALPYQELPEFIARLRRRKGPTAESQLTALQVEFVIGTVCRVGELRGAEYSEFDWERGLWTIPASRMKSGKEHVIPVGGQLRAVWDEAVWRGGDSIKNGKMFPVSDTAMRRLACRGRRQGDHRSRLPVELP